MPESQRIQGHLQHDKNKYKEYLTFVLYRSFDSSVGRAEDCSWQMTVILRSLVRLRLEGIILFLHVFLFSLMEVLCSTKLAINKAIRLNVKAKFAKINL